VLLAVVFAACGMAGAAKAQDDKMVVWYDRTDGSTYLRNMSATDAYFIDGYTIASEYDDLLSGDWDGTKGWKAFEDILTQFPAEVAYLAMQYGGAVLSMGSANPGPGNLTELTLVPSGVHFSPGESWFIGKPFTANPLDVHGYGLPGYSAAFKLAGQIQQSTYPALRGSPVPEPSTWLLATLAGLGLAAMRSRSKR